MNAALFMLTSAWMAGADAAPAAVPAPAGPAVVSTGSACGTGCATPSACDTGCGRVGLWSRLKGRFAKNDCCDPCPAPAPVCKPAPAPVCCKPAPVCAPAPVCKPAPVCAPAPVCCKPAPAPVCAAAPACDTGCGRVGLWSRLKGRFAKGDCCGSTVSACDGCASGGVQGGHPEVIPAPKDKKEMPKDPKGTKGGVTGIHFEPIVTPVVAPRTTIQVGPNNPF